MPSFFPASYSFLPPTLLYGGVAKGEVGEEGLGTRLEYLQVTIEF